MSSITVSAEALAVICRDALASVEEARERQRDAHVAYVRATWTERLRVKLTGKERTRQEILDDRAFSQSVYDLSGWATEECAKRLLVLCKLGDPVTVTGEDAELVFKE